MNGRKGKNNTANLITASRILLSVILLIYIEKPYVFLPIYLICGLTDFLDGYIARRTGTCSELGARLDSIADFFLFLAVIFYLAGLLGSDFMVYLPFLTVIFLIRILNLLIAALRYRSFVILHTIGNKLTGFCVFLLPVVYTLLPDRSVLYVICSLAALSALEEGIIHLTSDKPDLNRKSVFRR
jgi:CDP-diacylglycerol--glycerol-3-phosphate 3-phosphatidyltransferase